MLAPVETFSNTPSLASMRTAALTLGALGVVTRRRTAEAVFTTFLAAVFTGAFFVLAAVLGAGLPMLDRYLFFFDLVDGGVVLVLTGTEAPRHTPTATSTANPTLVNKIIL